jgi:hypothetical protein
MCHRGWLFSRSKCPTTFQPVTYPDLSPKLAQVLSGNPDRAKDYWGSSPGRNGLLGWDLEHAGIARADCESCRRQGSGAYHDYADGCGRRHRRRVARSRLTAMRPRWRVSRWRWRVRRSPRTRTAQRARLQRQQRRPRRLILNSVIAAPEPPPASVADSLRSRHCRQLRSACD